MQMLIQWLVVGVIGLGAVFMLARHFGLGAKRGAACPGCNSCAKPKAKVHADGAADSPFPGLR
jgi:hypothetical protein